MILRQALFVAFFTASIALADDAVTIKNGNVYFGDKQLTNTGHDSAAALAPDKRWIVFIRTRSDKTMAAGAGDYPATELWQIRTDGKEPSLLVGPRASEDPKTLLCGFDSIQFSTDGKLVYFVVPAYATSGAVHVVDTTNGKEHFLMAGSTIEVVRSGEYKDCLLVQQHRYFIGGGSYDWWWLFRPDGKEVGPVGDDTDTFKSTYLGQ